jgi:peptide deformylase
MLKIVTVPDKILSSLTLKVKKIDNEIIQLVSDMEKTLIAQKDPKGVGLAANQVGINLSLFIIKPSEKAKIKVFINPKILKSITYNVERITNKKNTLQATRSTSHKKRQPVKLEGCLSIPRIWGPVRRAKKIFLEYQNMKGNLYKKWFSGFEATIIQHEVDHLNGVVFTQKSMEQNQILYKEIDGELKQIEI